MPASSPTDSGSCDLGLVAIKIGAGDRRADALQVSRDLAPDVAAIEIVEARVGEMIERSGERRLLQYRTLGRRLSVYEKRLRKAGRITALGKLPAVSRAWLRVTV